MCQAAVGQYRKTALAASAANPLWQQAAKGLAPLVAQEYRAFKSAMDLRLQGKHLSAAFNR
jgi:hypothetical protein